MADNRINNVKIENCRLIFRNLSGKEGKFNSAGNRNFGVILDNESAKVMEEDGWNIKYLAARDADEEPTPWIKVKAVYGSRPPHIYLVTRRNPSGVELNEDTVGSIDYAEIENVDIIIRPYQYDVNGKTGISAYVKSMYVTVVEDELARKYEAADEEELPFD